MKYMTHEEKIEKIEKIRKWAYNYYNLQDDIGAKVGACAEYDDEYDY